MSNFDDFLYKKERAKMTETKEMGHVAGNRVIWDAVCNTPPDRTRPFYTSNNKCLTDVNPQWRAEKLTEVFGPCGFGWGYDIVERWREDWGGVPCCYVRLKLWYRMDGERYEAGEQIGGTAVQYSPDECWKMSITDALGKCAALLGVAADVYLGTFDTSKYRDKAEPPTTAKTAKANGVVAPATAASQKSTPAMPF